MAMPAIEWHPDPRGAPLVIELADYFREVVGD